MFGKVLPRIFAFSFALIIFSLTAVAQDLDDVTFNGKVTDSNGLAVVGAKVTVTSVDTGVSRSVVADDEGRYRIVKLKPGSYKIKAAANGFGTLETAEIVTISAQNVDKDFKLSPAGLTAETTVTVTDDDGPPVDTTRTIVGGTITGREIEEIPNNTRNALDLVLTLGGTSEEQLSTSGLAEDRNANPSSAPLEQGNFSISGGTAYSNNITIDGLDNNDDRSSQIETGIAFRILRQVLAQRLREIQHRQPMFLLRRRQRFNATTNQFDPLPPFRKVVQRIVE